MILKASQRGGAKALGLHLMKTEENEHVEIHEVSGFVADDLMGAMKEAHALSVGTKCRQFLFSVSLNPPANESVRVEVFEKACDMIGERMGLKGQPRMIVFHEKEGRRHAHAVWSRIDAQTMTAKQLSHFKLQLRGISKQLYLENGWEMPEGLRDFRLRDTRNMTLADWQQAKRGNLDSREVKQAIKECWAKSDNGAAFTRALEECGMYLAQGERNNHVAVTIDGQAIAVARATGERTKVIRARLGEPKDLPTVPDAIRHIGETIAPRLSRHIAEAKRIAAQAIKPLRDEKRTMRDAHRAERQKLDRMQRERFGNEQRDRSARVRKGAKGLWDIVTGRYFKVRKQNEVEAYFGMQRDRNQRHALVQAQLQERQGLQTRVVAVRERHARQMLGLYRDAACYRQMARGGSPAKDGADNTRSAPRGPELG